MSVITFIVRSLFAQVHLVRSTAIADEIEGKKKRRESREHCIEHSFSNRLRARCVRVCARVASRPLFCRGCSQDETVAPYDTSAIKRGNHDLNPFLERKGADHRSREINRSSALSATLHRKSDKLCAWRAYNNRIIQRCEISVRHDGLYSHRVCGRDKLFIRVFHNSAAQSPKDVECGCVIWLRNAELQSLYNSGVAQNRLERNRSVQR